MHIEEAQPDTMLLNLVKWGNRWMTAFPELMQDCSISRADFGSDRLFEACRSSLEHLGARKCFKIKDCTKSKGHEFIYIKQDFVSGSRFAPQLPLKHCLQPSLGIIAYSPVRTHIMIGAEDSPEYWAGKML